MHSAAAILPFLALTVLAADYRTPAEERPAARRVGAASILPGGRVITPLGRQAVTGPGAFNVAVNSNGRYFVTANAGPNRYSITTLERSRDRWRVEHHVTDEDASGEEWQSVSLGLVFSSDNEVFVSEGHTGRVQVIDIRNGRSRRFFDLNQGDAQDAYAGDLAFDAARKILYVVDQANARITVLDSDKRRIIGYVAVGQKPFAVSLSPNNRRLWVTESGGVSCIDVENPSAPRVLRSVRTSSSPATPAGVSVTAEHAYVSNVSDDSITVVDTASVEVRKEIPIRIPGLEQYRGVMPAGSLFNESTGWLLVAEAGINAVGVIDTRKLELIGHIPTAWFPTRLAQFEDMIFVACAKGYGTGPNATRRGYEPGEFYGERRRGAIIAFPVPDPSELAPLTVAVFTTNGFVQRDDPPPALPAAIRHVVLIVKEDRSYDEILGDVVAAANGRVNGIPVLARFGMYGVVNQRAGELQTRLGLRNVKVTPNHHAIAQRFSFSDNFYADSKNSTEGHRWLTGSHPDVLEELASMAPASSNSEAWAIQDGALWRHLEAQAVSFRIFSDQHGTGISDQARATGFIRQLDEEYRATGKDLPQMIYLRLPNDRMARARPEEGYPFEASFVADNDLALGRIVEYLTHSKWWPNMAIFVAEASANGPDHIDSHRTLMFVASPYAKTNHLSRVNTSLPGLRKTILRLLRVPPMNLYDAAAADLEDCFTTEANFTPTTALPVPKELFDPESVSGTKEKR